jgi:class 3 adenylate cyclase
MEREVRYCTTEDGIRIAYWTFGSGSPLVYVTQPVLTASEAEDKVAIVRDWFDRLARTRRVVRFDHRGTGLSGQNGDFSVEGFGKDVAAIAGALSLESFDLWGDMDGGLIAAAYAARHPEQVTHLALWNAWSDASEIPESETLRTLDRLISLNWPLFAQTASTMMTESFATAEAQQNAGFLTRNCDPLIARVLIDATWAYNIDGLLADIACPTLVMHRRDIPFFPVALAQKLAAAISDSRLKLIDGSSFFPWFEHSERIAEQFEAFLAPDSISRGRSAKTWDGSPFRTVLFTDLVGHTQMMSRLGDEAGRAVLREHEDITRDVLKGHGGTEIKTMGDGFMASFASVTKAVECAIALQRAIEERNGTVGATGRSPLAVRVGLNAGEPIEEDGDLFGATVILASRIAARAEGGEILVSDNVRSLSAGKGFAFSDRGEFVPKGFDEPVRVYEVNWRD